MYPVLFEVFGFPINTFGVMIAIGVMIASVFFRKRVAFYGVSSEMAWDLTFWLILFGTLGARLTYILLDLKHFTEHPSELFTLRFAGLTSYGAFFTGLPFILYWSKKHKISLINLLDAVCVPFLIGHAFGRIGCFYNGCCYGCYAKNPSWGVIFPNIDHIPHYPIQIYESLLTVLSLFIIVSIEKSKNIKSGRSFSLALFSYNFFRIITEFWRKEPGGTSTHSFGIYSSAQVVSFIFLIISVCLFIRTNNASQKTL